MVELIIYTKTFLPVEEGNEEQLRLVYDNKKKDFIIKYNGFSEKFSSDRFSDKESLGGIMEFKTKFTYIGGSEDKEKNKQCDEFVKEIIPIIKKTLKKDTNNTNFSGKSKNTKITKNTKNLKNLHIGNHKDEKLTPTIRNTNNTNNTNNTRECIECIPYSDLKYIVGTGPKEKILSSLFPIKIYTYKKIAVITKEEYDYVKTVMNNNKEFFEEREKKKGAKTFKLSDLGKKFVERKLIDFKKKEETKIQRDLERKTIVKSKDDLISECKEFMFLNKKLIGEAVRDGDNVLYVNFQELSEHSPQLTEALMDNPEEIIQNLETALEDTNLMKNPLIRITNLPKSCELSIERIRNIHLNRIISIDGRVASITTIRPHVVSAKFECPSCGTVISVLQTEKKFREPSRCSCGRKGQFRLLSKEMVDCAGIVLEDLQEKTDNPHAQRLRAVIKEDLVNDNNIKKFLPGNEIKCTGILKEVPIVLKTGAISTRFDQVLEVISVEELQMEINIEDFSKKEIKEIEELSKNIDKIGLSEINKSFAPDVEGYEEIKNALILQCSCKKNDLMSRKEKRIRNKPNIFLIGDPGIAKTVLGNFAVDITPHSRIAIGGGSSAVGITASVIKEEDGYRVEPGAFVLAKELLFLDELNNLSDDDKPKLQEAMESQSVTVNKANLHLSLKVTAGMLATANPERGTFNSERGITEQFNIPAPILNRFDIIFAMKDVPTKEKDRMIARKVISRERGNIKTKYSKEFLTKFFAYVRNQPKPEINDKVQNILEELYVKLREFPNNGLVINARFLVSLQRLIKASAKLRLSNFIEEKDIERAMDILAKSHFQTNQYKLFNFEEDKEDEPKY